MAFTNTTSTLSYAGNNSTVTAYSITFPYAKNADYIKVAVLDSAGVETVLTSGQYSVNTSTDELTTTTAYDNTNTVTIYREVPYTQELDLENGGNFNVDSVETSGLDILAFQIQQLARRLDLSLRFTETSTVSTTPLTIESTSSNGIFSVSGGAIAFIDAATLASWINLPATIVDLPTKTWANDGERATAIPDFQGQVGVQRDTGRYYYSTGTSAGNWAESPDQAFSSLAAHSGITEATKLPVDEGGTNKRSTIGAVTNITRAQMALSFYHR